MQGCSKKTAVCRLGADLPEFPSTLISRLIRNKYVSFKRSSLWSFVMADWGDEAPLVPHTPPSLPNTHNSAAHNPFPRLCFLENEGLVSSILVFLNRDWKACCENGIKREEAFISCALAASWYGAKFPTNRILSPQTTCGGSPASWRRKVRQRDLQRFG